MSLTLFRKIKFSRKFPNLQYFIHYNLALTESQAMQILINKLLHKQADLGLHVHYKETKFGFIAYKQDKSNDMTFSSLVMHSQPEYLDRVYIHTR